MDEAIDLAVEGHSPYPERAAFIDADVSSAGHETKCATDQGFSVAIVGSDGSTSILRPERPD